MTLSISGVLLSGVLLFIMIRSRSAGISAVVIAVLFGFFLGQSTAGPTLDRLVSSMTSGFAPTGNR